MTIKKRYILNTVILFTVILFSCGNQEKPGEIIFTANGENFAREQFTDRNGWKIRLNEISLCLESPTAYNPDGSVKPLSLKGFHQINLARPDHEGSVYLGTLKQVPPGNYQSLRFKIKKLPQGRDKGYSLVMKGLAEKKGKTTSFTLRFSSEIFCDGKDGYAGEEVKGLIKQGKSTTVEMTFHIDHIFGDGSAPAGEHVNTGAVGFNFFHRLGGMKNRIDLDQDEMKADSDYPKLQKALLNLPHLGEGHCDCSLISR